MHELGVLTYAVKTVDSIAAEKQIEHVRFVTLEIGKASSFVPAYFEKLFPVAIDNLPRLKNAELRMEMVPGEGLSIKDIGF